MMTRQELWDKIWYDNSDSVIYLTARRALAAGAKRERVLDALMSSNPEMELAYLIPYV
ncbi:MAG: hypothetical protein IJR63_06180 [Synergistaceae bacterium]|nr:hypothetical protein [Synergistaceae bacterium]